MLTRKKLPLALVVLVALVGLLAVQTGSAAAANSCGTRTTKKAFSKFGDQGDYYLVPGGSFEAAAGWTLAGGAKLVAGNETHYLNASTDRSSLQIPVGGSAATPWLCIGKDEPTIRYVARTSGGLNWSSLNTTIEMRGSTGSVVNVYLGQLTPLLFGSWTATPVYSYAVWTNQSWLFGTGDSVQVRFRFDVQGTGAAWSLDDVFVDPFKGI